MKSNQGDMPEDKGRKKKNIFESKHNKNKHI